jgi:murein DD-endopeptidase MepM/ murein hydrolase activator NlpD
MKLILLSRSSAVARHIEFSMPTAIACFIAAFVSAVSLSSYFMGRALGPVQPMADVSQMREDLSVQQASLDHMSDRSQEQLDALAVRVGELNARAIRLDALGQRLTGMAGLEDGEFNFENLPSVGGPLEPVMMASTTQVADFFADISTMNRKLRDQEQQLMVLEGLLLNRNLDAKVHPQGRPVKSGWMSSYFGRRTDPFTGKTANHKGVDFAGKAGSDVIAVAAGVVSYSGSRSGYGNMVEINHGNGYVTRYAHNQKNLVAPGDQVQPGQTIALIGSTGRATGPNLHFEVLLRGMRVDPVKYIRKTS